MEDFDSLSEDEQSQIEKRFSELERRIEQLEMQGEGGFTALKNQNRLQHYLGELSRVLEEKLGVDLPDLPSLEEPGEP